MLESRAELNVQARSEIEALLLAHPDVVEAAVILEEAADGRAYPMAYVVPDVARMREARLRIEHTDRSKRVAQWRRAFDQTYRSDGGSSAPSFVGWTNSYTGRPLPRSEMQEWLDRTVERIRSLQPESLLEIGCGVGLLVEALAPACTVYRGTDLSPVAVDRLLAYTAAQPQLAHVELLACEATDLRSIASASVDTVVLNSVIQYFPDLDYLRTVIAQAIAVLRPGGRIFIGDIRHFGLLPLFHGAVQFARAPAEASVRWLKRRIALSVEQDRELAIDPDFFLKFPGSDARISSVDVLLKRGCAHNELTRYRYDVVMHVEGSERAARSAPVDVHADEHTIEAVASRLKAGQFASAAIRTVPNRRLCADLAAARALRSADDHDTIGQVRAVLTAAEVEIARDPEEFWSLADQGLCDVRLSWTPRSSVGCFDAVLVAREDGSRAPSFSHEQGPHLNSSRRLATNPLEVAFKQQLGLQLQQMLSEALPDASCPAAVVAVDALPAKTAGLTLATPASGNDAGDRRRASVAADGVG